MTILFKQTRLFTPGPTPVPVAVQTAMADMNVYHRSADFKQRIHACREGLQPFFGTTTLPILLTASGTGAMDAAVSNLTDEKDKVLVLVAGKFGERWQKICQTYRCETDVIRARAPGEIPDLAELERIVKSKGPYRAVFFQANETSTGVKLPVKEIAQICRKNNHEGLIVVDAVSSICAHEMRMDDWQIDCVVSGSQKGFGVPPGLAFVALANRCANFFTQRPRFYFDLAREAEQQKDGQTAFTPATSLILGLEESLKMLNAAGVDAVLKHHQSLARAARAAAGALGLELLAPDHASDTLTAMKVPEGLNGKKILARIRECDAAIFAGGQDELAGKIIRMSHLGFVNRLDFIGGVAALEFALLAEGFRKFSLGAATAAAMANLN